MLLLGLPGPARAMACFDEPEDSPLFADSRQKAFAEFASQDRVSLANQSTAGRVTPAASQIIVVEGTLWHSLAGKASKVPAEGRYGKGMTRDGSPTCDQSCRTPTCQPPTCPYATCSAQTACYPTCYQPTCYIGGTCTPAQCRTVLYGVTIPQVGQLQMSFSSSASLQYTLQYCTNLSANQWLDATNAPGNGGVMTFSHTNNASLSFYRLLISQ